MITGDIILLARERLQDTKSPYLWEDWELFLYLQQVYNEWVKETGSIRDFSSSFCIIPILCNQPTYSLNAQITEVEYGYLQTCKRFVKTATDLYVSQFIPDWLTATGDTDYLVPDYDQGYFRIARYPDSTLGYFSGAVTFTSATKTIAQTGTVFGPPLVAGDSVVISGTVSNNGTFTVVTATTGSFTVSETVVTETATAVIIRKVMDTLILTVTRLGTPITRVGSETQSPEMRTEDHIKLVDGIMREAYLKKDSDTLDPKASTDHGQIFERNKLMAKWEKDNLRNGDTVARPDYGAL